MQHTYGDNVCKKTINKKYDKNVHVFKHVGTIINFYKICTIQKNCIILIVYINLINLINYINCNIRSSVVDNSLTCSNGVMLQLAQKTLNFKYKLIAIYIVL